MIRYKPQWFRRKTTKRNIKVKCLSYEVCCHAHCVFLMIPKQTKAKVKLQTKQEFTKNRPAVTQEALEDGQLSYSPTCLNIGRVERNWFNYILLFSGAYCLFGAVLLIHTTKVHIHMRRFQLRTLVAVLISLWCRWSVFAADLKHQWTFLHWQ